MAEAVVGQVVVKLGAALAKDALTFGAELLWREASALKGLFGKIRDSKAELESMQAYLQEAERFKDTDRTTAIFVGKIRGLAFQIEDVVDEFTYKMEEEKHGGFAAKTKKRLKHIKTWQRLAAKLQEIEAKLQDARRRKKDYSISRFVPAIRSTNQALHFTRDEDLVGIEENRERLIRWLTDRGGGGDMILNVSLEGLPYDLKNCFLHCALFPEDYVLKRKMISRQWIAAGFIREKEEYRTLEEVAEGYLVELVNRSLLQVMESNHAGSLTSYRMHDVIRLLALNKAKEERFGEVYIGSAVGAFSVECARRISVQGESLEQLTRSGAIHLRALHVFHHSNVDLLKPILTSSNLLSTLDLQGSRVKMLPNEVFDLFNLRYLGLRDTDIESLPEAVGWLQNLQVLDASGANLTYLPSSVVKLHKLRYLYAYTVPGALEALEIFRVGGVKVPNGIQYLAGLRALECVKATSVFLRQVRALTELRTFTVCNVRSEHSADLSNAITEMSHLVHLGIAAASENEVLRFEGLYLPPTLSWLGLAGQLEKTSMPKLLSSWSHLNSLTCLTLGFSNIDEQTFSCLCVLHGLRSLGLMKAFAGKRLDFYAGSFPKLRFLHIWGATQLNQVGIEKGALQNLVVLLFIYCPELKFLPDGIENLRALEKLRLEDTSEELIEKLRRQRDSDECNEDVMKISHISNVTVELTHKGLFERIR